MSVKIISYDLRKPETSEDYKLLIAEIKSLGEWAKPMESYWLVDTTYTPKTIYERLDPYLDNNDKLLVASTPLTAWWSTGLSKAVVDWIHSH